MSTKIEWAEEVWNPVTGCTKVSAGCKNCYAERMAKRFARYGDPKEKHFGTYDFSDVLLHSDRLDIPLHWRKPRRIFVCSMGDLFHRDVPLDFIDAVFNVMESSNAERIDRGQEPHIYMVLTKRPERMRDFFDVWLKGFTIRGVDPRGAESIWLGVSVEDQKTADERIPLLLQTPAAVRFVSCEPLLGPVDIQEYFLAPNGVPPHHTVVWGILKDGGQGIDWLICGGESGPGARPMHPDWARSLRDQCSAAGVPYFFKQWGQWHESDLQPARGRAKHLWPDGKLMYRMSKKAAGRTLDGILHNAYPKGE